jgi:hypothetical protein
MRLDINEVYHKYITKILIFSIFTFKKQIRNPDIYKQSVHSFVKKRIPWKINLKIETGVRFNKETERELMLDELLNGVETDYMSTVTIIYTTPLKQTTMEIDLREEDKYQNFIYS